MPIVLFFLWWVTVPVSDTPPAVAASSIEAEFQKAMTPQLREAGLHQVKMPRFIKRKLKKAQTRYGSRGESLKMAALALLFGLGSIILFVTAFNFSNRPNFTSASFGYISAGLSITFLVRANRNFRRSKLKGCTMILIILTVMLVMIGLIVASAQLLIALRDSF